MGGKAMHSIGPAPKQARIEIKDCDLNPSRSDRRRIGEIIKAIHLLAMPPEKPARRIGFRPDAVSEAKLLKAGKSAIEDRKTTK